MKITFSVNSPKFGKREIGRGEDAPTVNKDGIMIICDGTGATGQEEHIISGETYTSAYLGSRETSKIAEEFLLENYERLIKIFFDKENLQKTIVELGKTIRNGLTYYVQKNNLTLTVRGKSFKLLPTTFTAVVYKTYEEENRVIVISAGDSRALWWDVNGLHQLSIEDSDNSIGSAGDCSVSNCVSADGDFKLSFSCYILSKKGILMATSDGFTDPIKPFEQERYLIEWIGNFDNVCSENSHKLSEEIAQRLDDIGFTKRDDCSIAGAILGYSSDEEIKEDFRKRYNRELISLYLKPNKELTIKSRQAEENLNEAKIKLSKNEEQIVKVIKKNILGYIESLDNESVLDNEPLFKILTNLDAVSSEIGKENNRIENALKEDLSEIARKETELRAGYLEFSKLLCKEFGEIRFPSELIDTVKEYYAIESKLEEYSHDIKKELSYLKKMSDDIDELDDLQILAQNLLKNIELKKSILGAYKQSKETVDKYFSYQNEEIQGFFEEDIATRFSVLKKASKIPFFLSKKQYELKEYANRLISLFERAEEIKPLTTEDYIQKSKNSAYKKKLIIFSNEMAKELFYTDDCWNYIFDKSDEAELPHIEDYKKAKDDLEFLIKDRKDLISSYNNEYEKYLSGSKITGCILFRKAEVR